MIVTICGFAVLDLPQWGASVWSFWFNEPMIPYLTKNGLWHPHVAFSPWFITAPIGIAMFMTVLVVQMRGTPPLRSDHVVTTQRSANAAYNKLKSLIGEGWMMLDKFKNSNPVLPTDAEVKDWSSRLIALAETCASVKEVNAIRNSSYHIDIGEMLSYELGKSIDTYSRSEQLFGKLKMARKILERIEQTDKPTP